MDVPSPLVIAHRGASAAAPENTLAAFELAATLGADWVELDVRCCRDGELVLHHDAVLPDGRAVVELELAQLPPSVPSLAAALDLCAAAGLGVNVEIKALPHEPDHGRAGELTDAVADELTARLGAGTPPGSLLVTSFDPRALDRLRQRTAGSVPTGWLVLDVAPVEEVVARAAEAGHVALNPWDPVVDEDLVAAAHRAGLAVNAWTVDDPARLVALAAMGVDGVITNVPDVARTALAG